MTEGGGLNSPVWNKYAIKNNIISKEYEGRYEKLRDDYRFSTLVGKKLNCEVENLALSRNSNENIITYYELLLVGGSYNSTILAEEKWTLTWEYSYENQDKGFRCAKTIPQNNND